MEPRLPRLTLVGGGPSTAAVVVRLAERVAAAPALPPFQIVVIDRCGECGGGDPHRLGVHPALLLNDDLAEVDHSGLGFREWIYRHVADWSAALSHADDPRVQRWLLTNRAAIDSRRLDGLFLPRALFGEFIRERFAKATQTLRSQGIHTSLLSSTVTDITPMSPAWGVSTDGARDPIRADSVVLGVGSLLPPPAAVTHHPAFFSYESARDVAGTDARLDRLLRALPRAARDVVVIGSSAAASEVLSCLEGSPCCALINQIQVISTSGALPDGLPSRCQASFACPELRGLCAGRSDGPLTSTRLVDALENDIRDGRAGGHTIVDMLPALTSCFSTLFDTLAAAEKRVFVEDHFCRYRRLIRHTSSDYAAATRRLMCGGLLRVVHGRVSAIVPGESNILTVEYDDDTDSRGAVGAAAVFDCTGFSGARETAAPPVSALLTSGIASLNGCGRGLRVNERLEAADGLFVLGPLLAGTSRGEDHIWSLENIPRIYALADRISTAVLDRLAAGRRTPITSA